MPHSVRGAPSATSFVGRYDHVDCVLDLPSAFYPAELKAAYPDALFLATHRDEGEWFTSMSALVKNARGAEHPSIRRMYVDVYGSEEPKAEIWIPRFRAHYTNLEAIIPSEQLLVITLAKSDQGNHQPYEKICLMFRMPASECPTTAWPRSDSIDTVKPNPITNTKLHTQETEKLELSSSVTAARLTAATSLISAPRYAYVTLLSGASTSQGKGHVFGSSFLTAASV